MKRSTCTPIFDLGRCPQIAARPGGITGVLDGQRIGFASRRSASAGSQQPASSTTRSRRNGRHTSYRARGNGRIAPLHYACDLTWLGADTSGLHATRATSEFGFGWNSAQSALKLCCYIKYR